MLNTDDYYSDDEISFGPLTLREIKKHIFPLDKRQTIGCVQTSFEDEGNASLRIIETHSTPNVRSVCNPILLPVMTKPSSTSIDVFPNWKIKDSDDSFLKIEKLVEGLCVSPRDKEKNEEFDNTLEVVEYILKNEHISDDIKNSDSSDKALEPGKEVNRHKCTHNEITTQNKETNPDKHFVLQNKNLNKESEHSKHKLVATPTKNEFKTGTNITPSLKLKHKTPIFKTPISLPPNKKLSVTPLKKQYEHIVSPVASYIKNSPVVPLLKNVRPNKPLPSASYIPQPVKNSSKMNICNKENFNLPSTAYRSAKETKVIDVPDEQKLPRSQWAKHIASSIPRGVVMKHIHRETNCIKKHLVQKQEVSFDDLSFHQADLSVCTQKSALNKPKTQM